MAPPRSLAGAAIAAAAAAIVLSCLFYRRKCARLAARVREVEASLVAAAEKVAAERRGRVRAQQSLRRALSQQEPRSDEARPAKATAPASYPLAPIGTVQSCFSTRNGTPRQPLVVTLARATVALDPARVPAAALEGLASYSHCWILYVFHLNTDLDKLWKDPARSKLKAKVELMESSDISWKVRVPRLKGGKMGVLATRSPHRPNPIGLSVAKVEAVDGHALLLSGVDLVDGTPVLDIKPYLPYSDSVKGAAVPNWLEVDGALAVESVHFSEHFISALPTCWMHVKQSLYASADEFQDLIKQVLSWDIRSISQRTRPHQVSMEADANGHCGEGTDDDHSDAGHCGVVYHLHLEGIDVSYRIDQGSNIVVEDAALLPDVVQKRHGYLAWRDKLGSSVL
ncbi:uncharacterized protein LOC8060284 isoform X2 [Sorghum bicolor]|uniref:uncharacterized protein LOC8060284 isoform X2 n=1 Tax=Sorghum bicolor TaxID=4558 RepID=UPI000B423E9D|nr:uncharacterized protein LOC8060284 isoform X2 [Sorghum bicolor]|eukprot:XP_021308024.1 uncharacterized protein LOC8060284 isoform X2 [Sorghum bicolor]